MDLPRPFGPFLLLKSLGSGATGDVFLARPVGAQHDWPTPLVIKRMHVALIAQPELHARFQHEARIAQALSTPHVPRVHVVGEAEGTSYIAMDYVPGWTLSQILRARNSDERRPSLASTASIIGGILDGLIALHEAKDPKTGQALTALHRDLAPKNIMLGDDGVTRLIDLGLGKSSVQEWQTTTGVIMGTPGYMAPEQIFAGSTDVRTDLYTVGVVLWELIAGQFYIKRGPIHGMLREQVQAEARSLPDNIDAPQALKPVLQTAVSRSPEARFETARAFRAAFREATQDELPPSAPGPVDELITRELWAELEAARDELMDLTEAITVARPPAEPFVVETDDDPSAEETHDLPDRTEVGLPPMHARRPTVSNATTPSPALHARAAPSVSPVYAAPSVSPVYTPPSASTPGPIITPVSISSSGPSTPMVSAASLSSPASFSNGVHGHHGATEPMDVITPPPPAQRGRWALAALAVTAFSSAAGVGSVILVRGLNEEPAPAVMQAQDRSPAVNSFETKAHIKLGMLIRDAEQLRQHAADGSREAQQLDNLLEALSRLASKTKISFDQLTPFEQALQRLDRLRR